MNEIFTDLNSTASKVGSMIRTLKMATKTYLIGIYRASSSEQKRELLNEYNELRAGALIHLENVEAAVINYQSAIQAIDGGTKNKAERVCRKILSDIEKAKALKIR